MQHRNASSMTESELQLHRRIDGLEFALERLVSAIEGRDEMEWVSRSDLSKMISVSPRLMTDLIASGLFGDAVKNVGTVKRPRYMFHKSKAVNAYLSRTERRPGRA